MGYCSLLSNDDAVEKTAASSISEDTAISTKRTRRDFLLFLSEQVLLAVKGTARGDPTLGLIGAPLLALLRVVLFN